MERRVGRNSVQRALAGITSLTEDNPLSHHHRMSPVPIANRTQRLDVMMVLDRPALSPIVLVVEDEMLLRMRAVDMVEDAGYASVEAVDADEAFAVLKSRSDIALLFTDIQMPGSMDGLQLAQAVYQLWPSIKIILVSGQLKLSENDIPPDSRFFGKPLKSGEMTAQMRHMIGRA
jgi:CheY-like chemotaxis protein